MITVSKLTFRHNKAVIPILAVLLLVGIVLAFAMYSRQESYIYFLQNKNDNVSVVKSKLDGSDMRTVVEGTGYEAKTGTAMQSFYEDYGSSLYSLLARRDWRYVAYRAIREEGNAKLYIIDAKDDSLKVIDDSNSIFEFIGWQGDRFLYSALPKEVKSENSLSAEVKSYNVKTGLTEVIDSAKGQELIGARYLIKGNLVYAKYRVDEPGFYKMAVADKEPQRIRDFPDGSKEIPGVVTNNIYKPNSVYFTTYSNNYPNLSYKYQDGQIVDATEVEANNQEYIAYTESPDGSRTAWFDNYDSNIGLYIGDENGETRELIAIFDREKDFGIYGWYDNETVILQAGKNSNEGTLHSINRQDKILNEISKFTPSYEGSNNAMAGFPGAGFGYGARN